MATTVTQDEIQSSLLASTTVTTSFNTASGTGADIMSLPVTIPTLPSGKKVKVRFYCGQVHGATGIQVLEIWNSPAGTNTTRYARGTVTANIGAPMIVESAPLTLSAGSMTFYFRAASGAGTVTFDAAADTPIVGEVIVY